MKTTAVSINNQTFILHPSGALFWENKKMLLISDVHLGKISHFRKHGIAIPNLAIAKNFEQLTAVVEHFSPQVVVFLGDLFHSTKNSEWELFVEWSAGCNAEIKLIAGNHDVIGNNHYEGIGIPVLTEIIVDGFLLSHHPTETDGLFNFCGHIHPGIQLRGVGGQSLQLPCFFIRQNQMILPAFGAFTGKSNVLPQKGDIVYAIAKDEIIMVKQD